MISIEQATNLRFKPHLLIVDGQRIDKSKASITIDEKSISALKKLGEIPEDALFEVDVLSVELSRKLQSHSFSEVDSKIRKILFRVSSSIPENPEITFDVLIVRTESGGWEIALRL